MPLVLGAAAAQMGWIAADVHAKRLRASRIIDPTFASQLVVGTGGSRRRRVEIVAQMVEDMLRELIVPKPCNDVVLQRRRTWKPAGRHLAAE